MVRKIALVTASLLIGIGLAACEEKSPMEKAADHMEDAADDMGDAVEDAADDLEDAVD